MKYYPIADSLSQLDALNLNLKFKEDWSHGYEYELDENVIVMAKRRDWSHIQYQPEYTFRQPKQGEWFLSGATPAAYRAKRDLSMSYYIVELVLVKCVTITKQVEVIL